MKLVGALISSHKKIIEMRNILYASKISKNLLSVSKIIANNDVFIEFHSHVCTTKIEQNREGTTHSKSLSLFPC